MTLVGRPGRRMMRLASSSSAGTQRARAAAGAAAEAVRPSGLRRGCRGAVPAWAAGHRLQAGAWPPARTCAWSPRHGRGACLPRACALQRRRALRARGFRAPRAPWLPRRRGGALPLRVHARRTARVNAPPALPRSACAARRRHAGRCRARCPDAAPAAAGAVPDARAAGRVPGSGQARPAAGAAASRGGCASPGASVRRFTFSTTTALVRPCEKLCRTIPNSTGRFSDSVLVGATDSVLSPEFFESVMRSQSGPSPIQRAPEHVPKKLCDFFGTCSKSKSGAISDGRMILFRRKARCTIITKSRRNGRLCLSSPYGRETAPYIRVLLSARRPAGRLLLLTMSFFPSLPARSAWDAYHV